MKKHCRIFLFIAFFVICSFAIRDSFAAVPIATDSRIKTFVFSENEVFHLTIHYGYQSNIEFAKNEEIDTISVGDNFSWKISPVGRRLFIKALEGAAHTNMTVITNKHTYQFELESKNPDENLDDELVYVVRFFYPDTNLDSPQPKIDTNKFVPASIDKKDNYNFNYTLTGSDNIAPIKVFDDGKYTFLQFPNNNAIIPHIFIVDKDGKENKTTYSREGDYIVIKKIVVKIALKLEKDKVYIFNESFNKSYGRM